MKDKEIVEVEKQLVKEDEGYSDIASFVMGQPMSQETELGSVFRQMDSAENVDRNTRLAPMEISGIMIHDAVCDELECLPRAFGALTDRKKALAVSLKGEGRREKVEMVKGERSRRDTGSFMSRLGNLFRPGGGGSGD